MESKVHSCIYICKLNHIHTLTISYRQKRDAQAALGAPTQVDKSVQTDHDIEDFFADIGIEEYTNIVKKSYGVYTVEELLCVLLDTDSLDRVDFDKFVLPKSLRSKMKTIHARKLTQVIQFEFGTKLAESYSGKLIGKSALHVVENEMMSAKYPAPAPRRPKNEEEEKKNDQDEKNGMSKNEEEEEIGDYFSSGTFVAMRSEITPDFNIDGLHEPPEFWIGQVLETLSSGWCRVRILLESGPSTGTFVMTNHRLVVTSKHLKTVDPQLYFDSELQVWSSKDPRRPAVPLIPGIVPISVARSFQAEAPSNTNQFELFLTVYINISLTVFESDHRNQIELHDALKRFFQQLVTLKHVYTPNQEKLEKGEEEENMIAVDVLVNCKPQPAHVEVSVLHIAQDMEKHLKSSALVDFVKTSTDLDIVRVANFRVISIITTSKRNKYTSSSSSPSRTGGSDLVSPGDFVAFKNSFFAPIMESVDRPEWWLCRVERRVWGANGMLVQLRFYKETSLGSAMYLPTNDWFIRNVEDLHFVDMEYDPEMLVWKNSDPIG
jgi:hypothetical protein